MIDKIDLRSLTNNAYFQLQTQFGSLIMATGATKLKVEGGAYATFIRRLNAIIKEYK
ncbi:MAG: hypothetical protein LBV26_04940 [Bacteroidales bacterium]|jgi:hypothetical protein|nr:hypothetical protein [Bacteroidales bacterium]